MTFDNKRDASKAFQRCKDLPFMVGSTYKPIRMEWADLKVSWLVGGC